MSILIRNEKRKALVKILTGVDKRKRYIFCIASCYFTPRSALYLIKDINDYFNIERIEIYIDSKEAFRIGTYNLESWLRNANNNYDFDISIHA